MAAVGFIGLGNMGGPMAANLVKAGHNVKGFDLSAQAIDLAKEAGIEIVDSASAAAVEVDVVFSMLPAGPHVKSVFMGEGGVIETARPGTIMIDSSTIDVESARAVISAAEAAGHLMVDAPVSGGVAGAAAGTLTMMVGGSDPAFAAAEPFLSVVGGKVVHAGGAGNGQVAKVCNNMILGISMVGISEAFALGEKLGLDAQKLFDISSTASGSCWAMLNHNPVPGIVETAASSKDYQPGFAASMMLKDLKLSQEAANVAGAATPLGAQAAALYSIFNGQGQGDLDYSAIYKMIKGDA